MLDPLAPSIPIPLTCYWHQLDSVFFFLINIVNGFPSDDSFPHANGSSQSQEVALQLVEMKRWFPLSVQINTSYHYHHVPLNYLRF